MRSPAALAALLVSNRAGAATAAVDPGTASRPADAQTLATGERVTPGETTVSTLEAAPARSLTTLRRDFIPEILKSAEAL